MFPSYRISIQVNSPEGSSYYMSISCNIQALVICLIAMCVAMYALGLRACITDISFVSMSQLIICIIHPTIMAKYCDCMLHKFI